MSAIFNTGSNFAEGSALLSPLIQEIANEFEKQVGLEDEAAKIGIVRENPLTPDGKITAMVGPQPLKRINEDEEAPLITLMEGFSKGYKMQSYAGKHKVTKLFKKWIEQGAQIQGADSSVKQELNRLKDAIAYLVEGSKLTMNTEFTKVLANGFSITAAYGPGSASPDGKALFAADHIVKIDGSTYTNVIAGAMSSTVATAQASILAAIQSYKTQVKAGNGYRIKTPNVFTILVPRALETYARAALNTAGSQASVYSGTGSNANQYNIFSFEGNTVEIQVLDMLGEIDPETGLKIGGTNADSMWFLLNKELAAKVKAFRLFTLWSNEMRMVSNDETGSTSIILDAHFGVDFYNPECVMGYIGA